MLPQIFDDALTPQQWPRRREELVRLLEQQVYGRRPDLPYTVKANITGVTDAWGGRASREKYAVEVTTSRGSVELELALVLPKGEGRAPCVLLLSNHDRQAKQPAAVDFAPMERVLQQAPESWRQETLAMMAGMGKGGGPALLDIDRDEETGYWPVQTILASGRGAACFYASQAQPDEAGAFPSALAALFLEPGAQREPDGWGALGVWAFAASVMVTVLSGHPRVDREKISLAGHSRGGKAALWCAAQDPRVNAVLVNNSGCTGAAVSRGKRGEVVASISAMFPHWFCPNYGGYAWREETMPFDQHMLVAAVAPRLCYITSGTEDLWSDPEAEWRGAKAGSAAWELLGAAPLPLEPPEPGQAYQDGPIGYHRRPGGHDLTTWDYEKFLEFLDKHNG